MRTLLLATIAALFAASPAFADTCAEQAAAQKLTGARKNTFIQKCETRAGRPRIDRDECASMADAKGLVADEKIAFIKQCVAEGKK